MTVDSINTQAATVGASSAAVGLAAGYLFGGKRPNLEQVFAMDKDTFEAAVKEAPADANASVDAIRNARNELADVHNAGVKGVVAAETAKNAVIDKFDVDDALKNKVKEARNTYVNTEVDIDGKFNMDSMRTQYNNAVKGVENAEAKLKASPDDKTLQSALTEAKTNLDNAKKVRDTFLEKTKSQFDALKQARAEVKQAKIAKFTEAAKVDGSAKNALKGVEDAVTKANEDLGKKLAALKENADVKNAFDKIQGMFKKEGAGKTALWAAAILGVLGVVGTYLFANKDKKAA